MPNINITRLADADAALLAFSKQITDWRPFWSQLGEHLADETQRRWPLRRRTGTLRQSLTWAGDRLGRGGVFEADPDRLTFGSAVFYGRFAQDGTKRQRMTPLIHIDHADIRTRLAAWARDRAAAAGVEVE